LEGGIRNIRTFLIALLIVSATLLLIYIAGTGNSVQSAEEPIASRIHIIKKGQAECNMGENVLFEIAISNPGPAPANEVVAWDEIQDGLEYVGCVRVNYQEHGPCTEEESRHPR
jgi:uncharacterized repeat protein (TIGR01451 family)